MQPETVFYGSVRLVQITVHGVILGNIGYVHAVKIDGTTVCQHVLIRGKKFSELPAVIV